MRFIVATLDPLKEKRKRISIKNVAFVSITALLYLACLDGNWNHVEMRGGLLQKKNVGLDRFNTYTD